MKISMYVAASMDGFIARKDGSIDWLNEVGGETDFGYQKFFDSVDVLCVGNHTYQQMADVWPYKNIPSWIYSRTSFRPEQANVHVTSLPPKKLVEQLVQEGRQHLWVMGGGEIHSLFLNEDLVDEIRLFVMPIALGEGISLFAPELVERRWHLAKAKVWPGEVAELHYVRG